MMSNGSMWKIAVAFVVVAVLWVMHLVFIERIKSEAKSINSDISNRLVSMRLELDDATEAWQRAKTERTEREESLVRQLAEEIQSRMYYETAWQTMVRENGRMRSERDYWHAWADAYRLCWFSGETGFAVDNPACRVPWY